MRKSFIILLSFVSINLFAQDKIEAERPDESITAKTLEKKTFQAEIGFRRTKPDGQDKVWRNPNILLRYGLLEKLEIRLETTFENQKLFSESTYRNGMRPLEVGLKLKLIETKDEKFTSSIVGQVGIPPLASTSHNPGHAYHRVRLLFDNKVTENLTLNYNVGSDWDSEDQEQNLVYSFAPELQIGDKWEAYVELFGYAKNNSHPENVFDADIAYYVSPDCKVDFTTGIGLSKEAPKYFLAAGFSFRLKPKK